MPVDFALDMMASDAKLFSMRFNFSFKSKLRLSELVFSFVMASVSALLLALAILAFKQAREAAETTLAVAKLDALMAATMSDPASYSAETVKVALRNGTLPRAFSFRVEPNPMATSLAIDVGFSHPVTLDRSLQPCSGYPVGDCGYKIKLTFEARSLSVAVQVSSAFPEAPFMIERASSDSIKIPVAGYRNPFVVECSSRQDFGLMSLVSSDKFTCLRRPQSVCPRGTLPKALVVDKLTKSLELECGPPTKVARCPALYALSSFSPKTFDSGDALSATCVRVTTREAFPEQQPAPALRIKGRVCPSGYRSESSCTLTAVATRNGSCGSGQVKPVAGKILFKQNDRIGFVDCAVDRPAQTCGAVWQAKALLKINCVLDQPEFVRAI